MLCIRYIMYDICTTLHMGRRCMRASQLSPQDHVSYWNRTAVHPDVRRVVQRRMWHAAAGEDLPPALDRPAWITTRDLRPHISLHVIVRRLSCRGNINLALEPAMALAPKPVL